MSVVREAVDLLHSILSKIPIGSEPYKAVLSAVQGLSKHVSPSDAIPGVQQTTKANLMKQAQESAGMQSLNRIMGSPGGAGSSSGGVPPGAGAAAAGMPPALAA